MTRQRDLEAAVDVEVAHGFGTKQRSPMNIERLSDDPALRRSWLLSKALENAPLREALRLAQAADNFLTGGPCKRLGATEFGAAAQSEPEPQSNSWPEASALHTPP